MYKFIILTPVLVMLGAGSAVAFDAAQGFGPSDPNDQPIPRYQIATPGDRTSVDRSVVTFSIGDATRSLGFPAGTDRSVGFSAAQGFGPSDPNDQPIPRYQIAR